MLMEVYLKYLSYIVKMCKILIYELYIRVLKFPEKNIENPLILNFIYTRTAL